MFHLKSERARDCSQNWSRTDAPLGIIFLVLLIPVLIVRNAIEGAAAVGAGIGMIVFAVNYPVGFGITMAIVFLFSAVLVGFMPSRSRRGDSETVTDARLRRGR